MIMGSHVWRVTPPPAADRSNFDEFLTLAARTLPFHPFPHNGTSRRPAPGKNTLPSSDASVYLCCWRHPPLDRPGCNFGSSYLPRHSLFDSSFYEKPTTTETYRSFPNTQRLPKCRKRFASRVDARGNPPYSVETWHPLRTMLWEIVDTGKPKIIMDAFLVSKLILKSENGVLLHRQLLLQVSRTSRHCIPRPEEEAPPYVPRLLNSTFTL